jgi:polar amino acid transport system substrate-binding protein
MKILSPFRRALVLLALLLSAASVEARPVKMCTVPWAPFYGPELEQQGFISALSRAALARAGHESTLEFMPWARAMLEVKQGDRDIVMGAYYTDERAETYHFTDVIYTTRVGLVARRDLGIDRFDSLRDLQGYRIGYGRGWATSEAFDQADFLDKEPADNNVLNVRKLYAGRIDMIAMNFDRFRRIAQDEGLDPAEVVFLDPALQSSGLYLMVSRARPDGEALVADFNRGLQELRVNGDYDRILAELGFQ